MRLHWTLPAPLQNQPELVVSLKIEDELINIVSGQHLPALSNDHQFIILEFSLHNWRGIASVEIPPLPTLAVVVTTNSDPKRILDPETELAIVYGGIFGGLLILCGSVVLLILVLKYVQSSRREKDKGLYMHAAHSHVHLLTHMYTYSLTCTLTHSHVHLLTHMYTYSHTVSDEKEKEREYFRRMR